MYMHGVRGVHYLIFFCVLISGLILPAVCADQITNLTDQGATPGWENTTFNQTLNSTVTDITILLTPEPTVSANVVETTLPVDTISTPVPAETLTLTPATTEPTVTDTVRPEETLLPDITSTTPVPDETLTLTPATTEPTSEPTVTDTVRPEETLLPVGTPTSPVPVETLAVTPVTLEPTPEPGITLNNSRKENQVIPTNSSQKSLRAQARSPGKAPVNPAFLLHQNRTKQSQIKKSSVKESTTIVFNDGSISHVFLEGEIPSPVDFSYTSGQQISLDAYSLSDGSVFPSSYDLRNSGRVSTVKNQGSAGACWAFATIASLESSLLPGESWDFSENNMKNTLASTYTDGFDRTWDDGGNRWISTAYLARWSGPVLESTDPYSDVSGTSPSGLNSSKHVQDVYFLPVRSGPTDNDNIKNALTNLGAVQASIFWDSSYYNPANQAFYNPSDASTNHAITIVGWDDSYSRTNFATTPAGDGAFIVKNSWGTGWGENGYFYVSYYDLTIGDSCTVFIGEPVTNYDRVYSYDPLGWVASYGYGTTTAQYANVFTAQSAETLTAIGMYETFPGSFTARIYLDPVGGPVNASGYVATTSWSDSLMGYHTIDIPDVALKPGQKYSVVISASTPGDYYPIPVEYPAAYYSSHATAYGGESYISQNGATWTDLTTRLSNTNVCVKGYTTLSSEAATITSKPGLFRSKTGYWYLDYDSDGETDKKFLFGGSKDTPVVGDWDGDGITEPGYFRNITGYWHLDYNTDGTSDTNFQFGGPGDTAVVGDWDGDGITEPGLFRSKTGYWYLDYDSDGETDKKFLFGGSKDTPVVGDWDGDGITEPGYFRNITGYWYLDYNTDGISDTSFQFGGPGDTAAVGDWDGDGITEPGLFRSKTGYWYLDYDSDGETDKKFPFGGPGDTAVVGDWDGDGTTEPGIFRNRTGYWYLDYNTDGTSDTNFPFGGPGDIPIVGKWN